MRSKSKHTRKSDVICLCDNLICTVRNNVCVTAVTMVETDMYSGTSNCDTECLTFKYHFVATTSERILFRDKRNVFVKTKFNLFLELYTP